MPAPEGSPSIQYVYPTALSRINQWQSFHLVFPSRHRGGMQIPSLGAFTLPGKPGVRGSFSLPLSGPLFMASPAALLQGKATQSNAAQTATPPSIAI